MKNREIDRKALRKFGLLFGSLTVLIFGITIPLLRYGNAIGSPLSEVNHWPAWPWMVLAVSGLWALLHPQSLTLLHRPWMKFAGYTQWLNTRIIILLMFYLMILPIGLILRLLGKDSLHRNFDPKLASYRLKQAPRDKNHMEKPY